MRRPQWIPMAMDVPGLVLAAAVGTAALVLTRIAPPSPYVSSILASLVLGALVLNTPLRTPLGLCLPGPDREADRYAPGLRFTGKWVLRAGIMAMGLKVQTRFFGAMELALIAGVALAALPGAFFVSHALAAALGVRRPMADILAAGTMICGQSAVNAAAPIARAHRDEQGLAIAVVFLFSVVAMVVFRPTAQWLHLAPGAAGLWSGLAVNDLASAVAVGAQMGGSGGVVAAAAKSARILLLAPTLVTLALLRRDATPVSLRKSVVDALPAFILGYIALAVLRAAGDRAWGTSPVWHGVLSANDFLVDLLMVTVAAGVGLHLALKPLLAASPRAVAVGGGASVWMAGITLAMITTATRGATGTATLMGGGSLLAGYVVYRLATAADTQRRLLNARFESGAPLSLGEAMGLLDAREREGPLEDGVLHRVLAQLFPSIGELIPVRDSPLAKGDGARWVTYWEGRSGWALVAMCRDVGSSTPIHAHPHRVLAKAIEGVLEELRFTEHGDCLELSARTVLGHNDLVETNGRTTLHVLRVLGTRPAIDLQLRGPEDGTPGRRFRGTLDLDTITVGMRITVTEERDDRPGHGGEGAHVGRPPVNAHP